MKIESGKFYRCRDGSKARIYATDGVDDAAIHGAIPTNAGWMQWSWYTNGKYLLSGQDHDRDLITEWSDIEPTEAQVEAALQALGDDTRVIAFESTARAIARAVLNAPKGE